MMDFKINQDTGLTPNEQVVMDSLVDAWNNYQRLPASNKDLDEKRTFADGLHVLQRLLAVRIVRRDYPDGWTQK